MNIQNISSALVYENINTLKDTAAPSNEENVINESKLQNNNVSQQDSYSSSLKTISVPTKIYVDKVIDNALDNIAKGNNVEDNKRIVRLFSNLINENSEMILRKAYGI